ncbi:SprT-like domain-containing protein [Mycena indigotica]|uniref:SprT-like domain-containing protein n=1 Tax=Mycena indigotica TaxID=2126181 RepID=A0A8H6SX55_9AGAR|nr:SprT-like domain-containing protein [Mycena indigotica]KAF7306442.1 SprT-like domain-containing protein [Mycena indigotica]
MVDHRPQSRTVPTRPYRRRASSPSDWEIPESESEPESSDQGSDQPLGHSRKPERLASPNNQATRTPLRNQSGATPSKTRVRTPVGTPKATAPTLLLRTPASKPRHKPTFPDSDIEEISGSEWTPSKGKAKQVKPKLKHRSIDQKSTVIDLTVSDAETQVHSDASSTGAVRGSFSTLSIESSVTTREENDSSSLAGSPHSGLEDSSSRSSAEPDSEGLPSETESWRASRYSPNHDETFEFDFYANHWDRKRQRVVADNLSLFERFKQRYRNKLADCAEQVYTYFNFKVFQSQLPSIDKIIITWSNQLTATAGEAKYSYGADRSIAQIILSVKVLDTEEKVRLTMAHEMCHLATWIIDRRSGDASHGESFWKWAKRIYKLDKNTKIAEFHDYEMDYLYTWICSHCQNMVGRWRNSIDVKTKPCPKCKTVRLKLNSTPREDDHRVCVRKVPIGSSSSKQARRPKAKTAQSAPVASSPSSSPSKTRKSKAASTAELLVEGVDYVTVFEDPEDDPDVLDLTDAGHTCFVANEVAEDVSLDDLVRQFGNILIMTAPCQRRRRS